MSICYPVCRRIHKIKCLDINEIALAICSNVGFLLDYDSIHIHTNHKLYKQNSLVIFVR